jgi:hypothetical protein
MDHSEIRRAFVSAHSVRNEIRTTVEQRVEALASGKGELPVVAHHQVALHLVPIDWFGDDALVAMQGQRQILRQLRPLSFRPGAVAPDARHTLSGFIAYYREAGATGGYTLLDRNGIIEAVDWGMLTDTGNGQSRSLLLHPEFFEPQLVLAIRDFAKVLREFQVYGPIAVFLSIMNAKGATPYLGSSGSPMLQHRAVPIADDVVRFPEIVFDPDDDQLLLSYQPLSDMLWNLFGFESSSSYDRDRRFKYDLDPD